MGIALTPLRRGRRTLLAACAVALLLRLPFVPCTPPEGVPRMDLHVYHQAAVRLADSADAWVQPGGEFGYRAPLYFAYLALAYQFAAEPTYHTGQLATILLSLVLLVLLYLVVEPVFGVRVAALAVWLRAVLPVFVMSDVLVMTEQLCDVLLLGALLVLLPRRADGNRLWHALVLGVLLGAATLTRESVKGLSLLGVAWLVAETPGLANKARSLALAATGLLAVLAPWMWRNAVVWGSALPLSLTTGVNLHMGNHPDSTGVYSEFHHPDHLPPADLEFGTREYDRWHREKAVDYIRAEPGRFVRMAPRKVSFLVWPRPMRPELVAAEIFPVLPRPLILALMGGSGLGMAAVWGFGILGLVARPVDRYTWMTLAVSAYTVLTVVVAYGSPRYADVIHHLLLPPAAWAILEARTVLRTLRTAGPRAVAAWASLGVLALLWGRLLVEKLA